VDPLEFRELMFSHSLNIHSICLRFFDFLGPDSYIYFKIYPYCHEKNNFAYPFFYNDINDPSPGIQTLCGGILLQVEMGLL
jgi:hypothetical protein